MYMCVCETDLNDSEWISKTHLISAGKCVLGLFTVHVLIHADTVQG